MWVAVAPAFVAVALLALYVREPQRAGAEARAPLSVADARRLPSRYWLVVLLGAVFTLARFSEAFLLLRAQDVGLALGYVGGAYGAHARSVVEARGGHRAGGAARHGVRRGQPGQRRRAPARERHCRRPLECCRRLGDVPGRGGVRCSDGS